MAGTPLAYALLAVGVLCAAMTFAYSIRFISRVFRHDESKFIKDLEHHGHHVHEAPTVMWVPIAILVALFCTVGLLGFAGLFNQGLNPEVFIEEQMHHMAEYILPHEVAAHLQVPHVGSSTKLVGVGLSAVALAIGGYLGYNFYWTRKWDSWAWVQASRMRAITHSFLWNRWYMNPVFYRVFVDGTLALKQVLYDNFEARVLIPLSDFVAKISQTVSDVMYAVVEERTVFGIINTGVPSTVAKVYHRVKKTQTGLLSINIIYVVALLLLLIIGMMIMGGL